MRSGNGRWVGAGSAQDTVAVPSCYGWRRRRTLPVVDTATLKVIERLPGWRGRYFHSAAMTFAHYEFDRDARIHEHFHPEEEVYEVIEGELEIIVDGSAHVARPGLVVIVPANVRHVVRALTDGRVIVIDHPARPNFG
jgi:quercetin dioxygenase-like cupin family protein